jgi:hypothetical protein
MNAARQNEISEMDPPVGGLDHLKPEPLVVPVPAQARDRRSRDPDVRQRAPGISLDVTQLLQLTEMRRSDPRHGHARLPDSRAEPQHL